VVGQRWTLLIIRDAFYGVQRFDDFAFRLKTPRAVLSERLKSLTDAGLLERVTGSTGRGEYRLSDKGTALWPAVRALLGDEYYAPEGPRRVFRHAADEAPLDELGLCTACGARAPRHASRAWSRASCAVLRWRRRDGGPGAAPSVAHPGPLAAPTAAIRT
jgi:DNA-binding HxlR family transcriptional regulator